MDYSLGNITVQFDDYENFNLITDVNGNQNYDQNEDLQAVYTVPGHEITNINFQETSCYNIPLDASCNNCNLKVSAYYQNHNSYNGISYIRNDVNFTNSINPLDIIDSDGPEIIFKNNSFELYNNSIIQNSSNLNIELSDLSGINLYQGIGGHSLRYWFNDEIESHQIKPENFTYSNSCIGFGYLQISIPEKYTGKNTLHFEAWDNYNNRSYNSIDLNILDINQENKLIDNFLALPNPFKEKTYFSFQVSRTEILPIELDLKIFDLNGKLVKSISQSNIDQNFKTISWDSTNNQSSKVPNGTYIAYVKISSYNGEIEVQKHLITKMR